MNSFSRVATVLSFALGVPMSGLVAQAQPAACTGSPYRHFDFWVGDWEVTNTQGTLVGENTITKILKGCVLHEHWRGSGGSSGQSHNMYDLQTDKWHQTWVSDNGQLLLLDGGLDERGRMVLRGETVAQGGGVVLNEIAWERLPSGQVRQVWRTSSDAGANWQTVFNGLYTKK